MTSTGLDQRTLDALLADAGAATAEYDDALAWLEIAVKGPMEPVAAEVWAFDESFTRAAGAAPLAGLGSAGREGRSRRDSPGGGPAGVR